MLKRIFNKAAGLGSNVLSSKKAKLSYIVENKIWVVGEVGKNIVNYLNQSTSINARLTTTHFGIRNQIIHFGSVHTFLKENGFRKPHKSNKLLLTWFHFVPEDKRNKNIIEAQKYLSSIHTSSTITKNNLIELGVNPRKIVIIPLGIDLSLFRPCSINEKQRLREELGISSNEILIGSFQKDGVGWGKGLKPKLIKGPDIFIKVVEKLAKNYPVFVLLLGPARGYVELNLEKRNIPYKGIGYLRDFKEVAKYYRALDLYLITSRIEGGPKAILECLASKVPVVSAKVGMVSDIVENGREVLLTDIGNVDQIVFQAKAIIENPHLKNHLINNGFSKVQNYSWDKIVQRYYQEIYSKLL